MKAKTIRFFKKVRKNIGKYLSTNRLFLTYVIFSFIQVSLLRKFTLNSWSDLRPFVCDLGLIIIIGSFGYFIKPKKQFTYYFIWLFIFTVMCVVNSIYYLFYTSFASFSLLAELGLVGEVGDSVIGKLRVIDFIYIISPLVFILVHKKLKNGNYYYYVSKIEKGTKMFWRTALVGLAIGLFTMINFTASDASKIVKLWNRGSMVKRFGIVLYQTNDLIQSLTPKINSLFGYDEAAKEFKEFYGELWETEHKKNKYTDVLKDMNVIFIHMESIQNYLVNMELNGIELTPTVNKLSKEGMYFSSFYPQVSVGTSSDTEFTLNTSLMPVSTGTAFVSYYNRHYVAMPQILGDMGYYTFSTHANAATMWNRNNMHPKLGYQDLIFKDQFEVTKENSVGLGLNDYDFFQQLQSKLEYIEDNNEKYMGTIIQLSNHSPYASTGSNPEIYYSFDKLNLNNTYAVYDERTGEYKEITDSYLEDRELGDYFISAHYADLALGTFFDYVKNSDYYENTVFVLYGDHDARIAKSDYEYLYNYNTETGERYKSGDEEYVEVDSVVYELSKSTPLIIWTKNKEVAKKIKYVNNNVMGMYDVLPTIGNMMGFSSPYALGHDIYEIGDNNIVIFPNGNFLTNKGYYSNTADKLRPLYNGNVITFNVDYCNNSGGRYKINVLTCANDNNKNIDLNMDIEKDYINELSEYTEKRLAISNNLIVYDLIYKEGKNIKVGGKSSE